MESFSPFDESEGSYEYGEMDIGVGAPKNATRKLQAWLKVHLMSSIQSYFGHVTKALISSPGFDGKVNIFCNLLLDEAADNIPELKAALYIPGVRHKMLKIIKKQVKEGFVLLLMASGSSHGDAQNFVNAYISDNI
eukprot:TRINITY_DN17834_c0_g1_i1.p1 TRINITY_DN17834_c0_g1~~TRINITY_DN17834_c0_g1_i1.p1  ORF type:complete len:136 (-),score=6.76 TRINITY_DN17834_c0_g1_i1:188-595(-)